jgi:hypothetical protein
VSNKRQASAAKNGSIRMQVIGRIDFFSIGRLMYAQSPIDMRIEGIAKESIIATRKQESW